MYVNGILTNQSQANQDRQLLELDFENQTRRTDVQFFTGYNASHLAGYGDFLESISQGLGFSLSDFDFDTILNQIAPEVTTRKILLVGHSQGTFYTNEMYGYLIGHGVPTTSIAVYNLGTPASYVAGNGTYLTSTNDKLVNEVREIDEKTGAPLALPGNITFPREAGYETNDWGGHSFADVYLADGANRIVSDIQTALSKLSTDSSGDESASCFTPPVLGLAYEAQKAILAVADPISIPVNTMYIEPKIDETVAIVHGTESGLAMVDNFNAKMNVALNTAISNAFFSIFPKPDAESASVAFAVEKNLYGSSLTVDEYKALLNGDNPFDSPDDQNAPQLSTTINPESDSQTFETPPDSAPTLPSAEEADATTTAQAAPAAITPVPQPTPIVSAGFGGGGAPPTSDDSSTAPSNSNSNASSTPSTPASASIPVYVSSPSAASTFGTTTVTFSGTTTPGYVISLEEGSALASSTADQDGNWSIAHTFAEGSHTIRIGIADGAGSATSTTLSFSVNTGAPGVPSPVINECEYAAVPCLVTTTSLTLSWGDTANTAYYEILRDGVSFATTTATTSPIAAESATSTSFAVVAHSYSGQSATSTDASVIVGEESDRSGAISTSEVWRPSGNPYIINSTVTVPAGVSLTIEPGTIIKVGGASPDAFAVSGTLIVGDDGGDPVIITSLKDDTVSGDTNGDGSATTPAAGDWTRIDVLSGGSATIQNAEIRYGGEQVSNPAGFNEFAMVRNDGGSIFVDHSEFSNAQDAFVQLDDASSTIENSTFHDVSEYGVWAHSGGTVSVLSSTLETESSGIFAAGTTLKIGSDTFSPIATVDAVQMSDTFFQSDGNNTGDGAIAISSLPDSSYTTLPKDGLPYSNTSSSAFVPAHASLTIGAGAIFKSAGPMVDIAGTLKVGDAAGDAVVFTSVHDDSYLGHLKNEPSTAAAPKDWQGITVESGASATFANVRIEYAGDCVMHDSFNDCAAIRNLGGTLSLDHAIIADENDTGIGQQGSAVTSATYLSFENAANTTGISLRGGTLSIHQSNFANLGTSIDAHVSADATDNWWGDVSGPRNPTTNSSGTGTFVTDGVTFDPWLVCDPIADASCSATNQSSATSTSSG